MDSGLIVWQKCLNELQQEFPQEFSTWLGPLHPIQQSENVLTLLAPNPFVLDWVQQNYLPRILELVEEISGPNSIEVKLAIGSHRQKETSSSTSNNNTAISVSDETNSALGGVKIGKENTPFVSNLFTKFTFDNFVEGSSNQLALAAAMQVAEHPGDAYNPLYIYGGVGLGKTHLMHAIGNSILKKDPTKKVLYLHSERYVGDMVKALQRHSIDEFKRYYRSVDVLMIDDIQFFAGKDRSQEEFFHTFNHLFEGQRQVILTCDRYPKEINHLDERLKSRFGWGLTVAIEPPELETRVAILMNKAHEYKNITLNQETAFFIAKHLRSNVRELEGALKRVVASAQFTGKVVTVDFVREALKDLLAIQEKLITIDNIQKMVSNYFKVKLGDLMSKSRSRSIAYPRQIAMSLAKELTNHSLPEIGDAFGGRDHTTVLHACRKIKELLHTGTSTAEDYKQLMRLLTT